MRALLRLVPLLIAIRLAAAQNGTLIEDPPPQLGSYAGPDLLARLSGSSIAAELLQFAFTPECNVDVYRLTYHTTGGRGEATTASGALMVPTGTGEVCRGARPVVLYAHGTAELRSFDIANLDDAGNVEGLLIATVFASQGYIVVAPNYAGYAGSTLGHHPYLVADQQSRDMIDALSGARSALPVASAPDVTDGGRLFITGYSQGGHVAMATHRALEAEGAAVAASAPMSGPYALAAFGDAIFLGNVSRRAPVSVTLLISAYQHVYGDIYADPTEVFEAQYAPGIETLLPATVAVDELVAQGRLPRDALFSDVPPDPVFAPITPPVRPEVLAPVFARGFGPDHLIRNDYRLAYLRDSQAAPDGGSPTAATGLPASIPGNALRRALLRNDLRNWTPVAPVLLCGGRLDPDVFYLNTRLMQDYWAATAPSARVTVIDLDSPAPVGDPFAVLKENFALAKLLVAANAVAEGATDGGRAAVLDAYHAGLVPPFCLSVTKSFFDRR